VSSFFVKAETCMKACRCGDNRRVKFSIILFNYMNTRQKHEMSRNNGQ
jgi:hypothetical protein